MATAKRTKAVDVSKLTPAQVDKMSLQALQAALKSVLRPGGEKMHQNHNSHSNIASLAGRFDKSIGAKGALRSTKATGAKRAAKKTQR